MGGEVSKPGGNLQNIKTRAQGVAQATAAKGQEFLQNNQNLQNIKTRAQEATQATAAKGQEFLQNNQNLQNIKTRAQEVAGVAPSTSNTIAPPTLAGARDVHEKSIKDLSEAVMILSKKVGGSKKRKHTKKRKSSKKRKHTKKRKYSKKTKKTRKR
jgi:hypothetical protein